MEANKAKEFRIGNFVEYHDDGLVFEILEVDQLGLRVKNEEPETAQETWIEYDSFSPIKLTEEWLVRLGWEWDIFHQGYTDGNWVINPNNEGGYRISYGKRRHDVIVWNIQCVHQLQNLCFALTGVELQQNK